MNYSQMLDDKLWFQFARPNAQFRHSLCVQCHSCRIPEPFLKQSVPSFCAYAVTLQACRQNSLLLETAMLRSALDRSSTYGEATAVRTRSLHRQSTVLTFLPRHGKSPGSWTALFRMLCAAWPSPLTAKVPISSEARLDPTLLPTSTHCIKSNLLCSSAGS